jgi:hypothetical protein
MLVFSGLLPPFLRKVSFSNSSFSLYFLISSLLLTIFCVQVLLFLLEPNVVLCMPDPTPNLSVIETKYPRAEDLIRKIDGTNIDGESRGFSDLERHEKVSLFVCIIIVGALVLKYFN